MDTLQYIKHRKKHPSCQQEEKKTIDQQLYRKLGGILSQSKDERDKMEVSKPDALLAPALDLDFIF